MQLHLEGRHVLITGGSKGIGLACAETFLREGCRVTLVARDAGRLAAAQAQLASPDRVSVMAADLSQGTERARVHAACPSVDVLINNAGAIPGGGLLEMEMQTWDDAGALKVMGFIHLTIL